MHTDHESPPNSDVNPESIKQGYETDRLNVRTILYVPIALVFTFGLAYLVVTLIIENTRLGPKEKSRNPMAAARNEVPIKDRLNRMSSSDPSAESKQPRLEGALRLEGDGPPYVRSTDPLKEGNSRQFHPEEMRPNSSYAKELGLQDYTKDPKDKEKVLRIPIEEAIKLALANANYLKSQTEGGKKDGQPVELRDLRGETPTTSNPQLGIPLAKPTLKNEHEPKKKQD